MVQILNYLLVAAGLSYILADHVDIVGDMFVCQNQGCTLQRLPVDLPAFPALAQRFSPLPSAIVGHRNHRHEHRVVKSIVHAVHAAMRDEQVSPLKDSQLVYRLVDEYILRNPAQLGLVEITANRQHHRYNSVPDTLPPLPGKKA